MKRITLLAGIAPHTSYGLHAIQMVRDLERLVGVHVAIRPINVISEWNGVKIPADILARVVSGVQPEPWEILLSPPMVGPTPGKKTAFVTMHESTRLGHNAVALLNSATVVIVPSAWNASCFDASGVRAPMRIVPLGVNTSVFNFRPYPKATAGLCVFGTAGRSRSGGAPRKGVGDVIDAFCKAFPTEQDVRLHIKCYEDDIPIAMDARIKIVDRYLTEQEMAEWFANIHCFVSGAKAEGWGLFQHQALACGRPLISVRYGGVSEFFDRQCGYPVEYTLHPAEGVYEGLWAYPSTDDLIAQMRRVYLNQQEAIEKGMVGAENVKGLSWDNSCLDLAAVLEEFGAIECGSVRTRNAKESDCGVIAYLPPKGVGHTDVFLSNLREHPPTMPLVLLTDGDWPDAVRIDPPTKWFNKSDQIASYVFLRALQEAETRGWKYFVWLETDCRLKGPEWDRQLLDAAKRTEPFIAAGNLAICNPVFGTPGFNEALLALGIMPTTDRGLTSTEVLIQSPDTTTAVPFVNGAPAVYCVEEVRALFRRFQADAARIVVDAYGCQDRTLGEAAVGAYGDTGALKRFVHLPKVMATAGETFYPFNVRRRALESGQVLAVHPIKNQWRPAPPSGYSFHHSGDLGDVIYGLKAVELIGGGALALGPDFRGEHPPRGPISKETFQMLEPLLKRQKYLTGLSFAKTMPPSVSHDLNEFRELWMNRTQWKIPHHTLAEMHCYLIGVESLFNTEPWLTADVKEIAPLVFHRSARYQERDFPWKTVVARFGKDAVFVGTPDEHKAFTAAFGKVAFYQVRDFDEMAAIINGAAWFMGNQSFPLSLALGLGRNVFQETCWMTPDCMLKRANVWNQRDPIADILEGVRWT